LRAEAAAAAKVDAAATSAAIVAARACAIHARLRISVAGVEAGAAMREVVGKHDAVLAATGVAAGTAFIVGTPAGTALAALVALAM
jgi:hypothetical protein